MIEVSNRERMMKSSLSVLSENVSSLCVRVNMGSLGLSDDRGV